jgi:hypothetical protein
MKLRKEPVVLPIQIILISEAKLSKKVKKRNDFSIISKQNIKTKIK